MEMIAEPLRTTDRETSAEGPADPGIQGSGAASTARTGEYLTFRLGAEEYGIEILRVQEIRSYEAPTRIAGAPPHVTGVVNLRGVIVPIVDLRLKLNCDSAECNASTVIIVLDLGGSVVGAVVDSVSDVVALGIDQIKPAPQLAAGRDVGFITGNRFALPGYWGSGKRAAADGTKWSMYEKNLLSEYHIRYGGYGGIGYYHVSDTYIALFSHFIPCGVYEAIYILDGLIRNQSDIRPDTVHGDTQAQSTPVFALAHLLGIELMPRIRNIKDLVFFKPGRDARYQAIQPLFSGGAIDWDLIARHYEDMLRVAVSIKAGMITPSTLLRRLGSASRKNKLYFAFRELGRAIRTMFLLRYISEPDLRRTIHAETNKTEEFHQFAGWAFFGGEGIMAENVRHEQRKVVKYNHLVANMIILNNVHRMSKVLKEMQDRGAFEITEEVLAGLSPYRTIHINRFGDYLMDLERAVEPMNTRIKFGLKKNGATAA